jgi:hypothetical protein
VLLFIGGVAVAIYAFASRGGAVDDTARTVLTVFGIVFALVFTALAYGLVRSVFPPKARHVKVEVERAELKRGEDVLVRVEVSERASDRLELGLVCTEYYDKQTRDAKGNTNRTTAEAVAFADWRPQSAGPVQSVRFTIPAEAPYSFRGNCVSYVWRVSAREPRRLRFDPATNVHLVVRP